MILSCVLLGGGAIALGLVSYRSWKVGKAAYREYLAEEEAAASKDDWKDEEWDIDPDEIATEATQEEESV